MKYIILLFILLFSINSYSQQDLKSDSSYYIRGKVFLDNFGVVSPLSEAVVRIVGTRIGVITKKPSGEFLIDSLKPGLYKIKVYYFGYPDTDTSIEIINESIDSLVYTLKVVCNNYNEEIAEKDIRNNTPKLLLIGGFAPIYYKGQKKFERKYRIEYFDFGDYIPECTECFYLYNYVIFKYLDKKFGRIWRKEVRKDVLGFKE